ncbi:MAG: response regulator [Alphaproteobacteria bacterium]|nr:response regulator [Alphaproteobacteria bacterium]
MSTVLVVEDNELNRRLFVDLLSTRGYKILEATDGQKALDMVQKHEPDLVLMDIQLPGVSGLDVTAQIRSNTNIKQPRIVAISAFALKQDVDKAIEAGCDDYISKPIAIASFFQTIEKNLQADQG